MRLNFSFVNFRGLTSQPARNAVDFSWTSSSCWAFFPKRRGCFLGVNSFSSHGLSIVRPWTSHQTNLQKPLPDDAIATSCTESDAFFSGWKTTAETQAWVPRTRHNPTSSKRNLAVPGRSPICGYFPPTSDNFERNKAQFVEQITLPKISQKSPFWKGFSHQKLGIFWEIHISLNFPETALPINWIGNRGAGYKTSAKGHGYAVNVMKKWYNWWMNLDHSETKQNPVRFVFFQS